jgi:peptidoglycan/LPS O-acetylase OafA/YrhL
VKRHKLLPLESLRGIAALSVAFLHFNVGSHFNNSFVGNAWIMVDFFFVLSGFVIALNYIDKITTAQELYAFQKKRFLRLYPLHLIMLFAFVGLELVRIAYGMLPGVSVSGEVFSTPNDIFAVFANIVLLQNFLVSMPTFNYPSWSISSEFFTYLAFGLIVLFSGTKRRLFVLLLPLVLFSGILLSTVGMEPVSNVSGPLRCIYSFFIGAITFLVYDRLKNSISLSTSFLATLLLLATVLVVILFANTNYDYVELIPMLFAITILSLSLTERGTTINRMLSMRWLVYLGTISYGIYMIHAFVWLIINVTMRRLFNIAIFPTEGSYATIDNIIIADLLSVLGMGIVIILAHLSYKYIETRFNKLR